MDKLRRVDASWAVIAAASRPWLSVTVHSMLWLLCALLTKAEEKKNSCGKVWFLTAAETAEWNVVQHQHRLLSATYHQPSFTHVFHSFVPFQLSAWIITEIPLMHQKKTQQKDPAYKFPLVWLDLRRATFQAVQRKTLLCLKERQRSSKALGFFCFSRAVFCLWRKRKKMHFKGRSRWENVIWRLAQGLDDAWRKITTSLYVQILHTPPAKILVTSKNVEKQQI